MSTKYESNIIVMTNEEIEKAAEDYSKEYWREVSGMTNVEESIIYSMDNFKAGAKFVNKYWQERTRWIPVEEKIPPRQSRTRQILAKNKHTVRVVFISCTEEGYLNSIDSLKGEFTEWKEIEL